jgi:hypothetical protein
VGRVPGHGDAKPLTRVRAGTGPSGASVTLLDPSTEEDLARTGSVTVAFAPTLQQYTHVSQTGMMEDSDVEEARCACAVLSADGVCALQMLHLCVDGCAVRLGLMKECLLLAAKERSGAGQQQQQT